MIDIKKVDGVGQIKEGETLVIEKKNGVQFVAQARKVLHEGEDAEEIVLCKGKNDYFIMSLYLAGESWVKAVFRLPDVKLTSITNNMRTFVRH